MGKLEQASRFVFSKTAAAGILGFLLSIFTTEILFAVPAGLELLLAEVLLIPVIILLLYVLGVFKQAQDSWWSWRRFRTPIKLGVFLGYVNDNKKGKECQPQFSSNNGWLDYFKQSKSPNGKTFDVQELYWSEGFAKFAVLINPFGETYIEEDRRNFATYERIKDFVSEGGIFCCTGGFPFYYYWDPIIDKPIDTTPKTRINTNLGLQDIALFYDSLVTKDFGAIILNSPNTPTLAQTFQKKSPDIEFFGDLSTIGGTDQVLEFRSLSEDTRGLIPGLRIKHGEEEQFPLAAISYGEGYLIIAGMAVRTNTEVQKLQKAIENFATEIAKRRQAKK